MSVGWLAFGQLSDDVTGVEICVRGLQRQALSISVEILLSEKATCRLTV